MNESFTTFPAEHARHVSAAPSAVRKNRAAPGILLITATLGLWLGCLAVGILGFVLPYPHAYVPKETPPVIAKVVDLSLPPPPPPAVFGPVVPDAPQTPDTPETAPPPPAEVLTPPDAAPLIPVALPSPKIAAPLPVATPAVKIVEAKKATATPPVVQRPVGPPPVRRLQFGVGQGAQPNPEYPREAQFAGQQGTVRVQFSVGPDGHVIAAELAAASRWPLLNQAVLRKIRESWFFGPGEVRNYEISIVFQLAE